MRVIVAGGGTGGHPFGVAIAEEVKARGGEVLFVGSARGLEARVVPAAGWPLETLEVSGLKRVGAAAFARGLARLPLAFGRSLRILRRFRPDVVVGVGGYASGPFVLTAALTGYATAIQEQNSVPGFTNRLLGRFVDVVFTAFPDAAAHFPARKIAELGNPVRRRLVEALASKGAAPAGTSSLLVVGGSQGARAVNDLVLGAVEVLSRKGALPSRVVHQTGPADHEQVQKRYEALGLGDKIEARPFIEDMASAYGAADVVVGRAGALTLAELAVAGRPALLIPLPTAADDHQTKNAEAFARAGAARVLPQGATTAEALADGVARLLGAAPDRAAMASAMRALARPDAARAIVDRLQALRPTASS